MAGMWKHHETFDGTYSFIDLLDIQEVLDVKEANEQLIRDALKGK